MTEQKGGQPASAIKELPEDLFEWDDPPPMDFSDTTSLTSPLRTLKTIIWSIDWEITDQILKMLIQELIRLMHYYREDETVTKFLQLLGALGRYITKRRGKAHPESVNLLRDFFVELERIVFMIGLSESERNSALQKQMDKFNALKKKLAASRTAETSPSKSAAKGDKSSNKPAQAKKPPEVKITPKTKTAEIKPTPAKKQPEVRTAPAEMGSQALPDFQPDVFRQMMLDEMRLVIRYEFKKLKAELKQMIENK